MKRLSRWFIDNPVAANLLMVMILAAGLLSLNTIRVESFPQMPATELVVSVSYPGGTASQIDASITQRIEDELRGLAGVAVTTSTSNRGYSEVRLKKRSGTELNRLLEKVRSRVDAIAGLPVNAERPQVYSYEFTNLASYVLVYGDVSTEVMQQAASRLELALKRHPQLSQISNQGKLDNQLVISPDPLKLQRYGIDINQLAETIQAWSLEYRSGLLKTAQGELVLRGDGNADNLMKLNRLPVINADTGSVFLEDIAEITRGFSEDDSVVRFQGKPAVSMVVSTSQKDNLFEISKAVEQVLAETRPLLPANVQVSTMADMSPYIEDQLTLLTTNAWQGLIIILVLLGLFLNLRLAFWVALGIPISLAGALAFMGPINYSINDITLFGMILVLGILVDDAVVVGESIHEQQSQADNPKDAAEAGVNQVSVATVFGVLTTIAAFSPMLWIENELAKLLAGFSAVVVLALIFSLIESKFILPAHLSKAHPATHQRDSNLVPKYFLKLSQYCKTQLIRFVENYYLPALKYCLRNKPTVLLFSMTFIVLCYGMLSKGVISSVFFPEIPGRYATATITMNRDAPLALAKRNLDQLETALNQTNLDFQKRYQLSSPPVKQQLSSADAASSFEIVAEFSSDALKRISSQKFIDAWQLRTGEMEASYAIKFSASEELAGGTAITVTSPDRSLSRMIAKKLRQELATMPGVADVFDDSEGGQRTLTIKLTDKGRQLGLTQAQIAVLIGGGFGDIEVQRLLHQGQESKTVIRFAQQQRKTIPQLLATPVHLNDNSFINLSEVASLAYSREPKQIKRRNRQEVITIYWRQDRSKAAPEEVWLALEKSAAREIMQQYKDVKIQVSGELEELGEVQVGLKKALLLTLLLIYVLLAVPLKSYWQPFVLMSVIPFAYAGAILGHGLMGLPVSLLSMFGMMAVTGVVINDSLVLMTRFNQNISSNMSTSAALIEAGKSRFRAIFLTTVTTICGLLPLLLESSEQAQYLKPAAVSLVFGELFATPITLVLLPLLLGLGKYNSNNAKQAPAIKTVTAHD